jgi:hypothetical protein
MNHAIRQEVKVSPVFLDLQEPNGGPLRLSRFQKEGTRTAVVRQNIVTLSYYNAKQYADSMTETFVSTKDFNPAYGFGEKAPFEGTERRVAFENVPVEWTLDDIQKRLAQFPNARIYKVMSNYPILSSQQENAITRGLRTLDDFAERQAVRYSRYVKDPALIGKLTLVNNKVQYRKTFLSVSGKPDEDHRTTDPTDFYETEKLKAERMELIANPVNVPTGVTVISEEELGNTMTHEEVSGAQMGRQTV